MSKKRRSFTIDPDIHKLLAEDTTTNASALVNQFLKEYYETGKETDRAFLRQRLDHIERQIAHKRDELELLREERERIETELDRKQDSREELIEQAKPIIRGKDDPENPAVRNWAGKLGMDPEEFLTVVKNGHS